jgi:hypothetical protein
MLQNRVTVLCTVHELYSKTCYFADIFAYKIGTNTGGATSFESVLALMGIHNPDESRRSALDGSQVIALTSKVCGRGRRRGGKMKP